ncbi:uncharacterized protein B0P05DRAFT_527528 [Gilbertella persicaria]|uniref:uncharacterized protein n=1 Tax=Gilbertella persicaria TaxID=101096 RepID=UPI00221F57C0|nr:uncharacterized protein B0P05DRAFT_527528 [Gilbertella persicaria]KAI8091436.1 hypothetical protein B0P05DRAFT_527528 [Gilbertella persicaria]
MRILTWNVNGLATTIQYHPWSETKSFKVNKVTKINQMFIYVCVCVCLGLVRHIKC